MENLTGTAVIITEGFFHTVFAKTAHGLVRHTDRFDVLAVIDGHSAGMDSGQVLDNKPNGIPIYANLEEAVAGTGKQPQYCIVGIATAGGILPESLRKIILQAIRKGISVISGLHQYMNDIPELREAAMQNDAKLIDIRKPKHTAELSFWTGKILELNVPRLAVLGMDCAVGKRTTCGMIHQLCQANGIQSEMLYTGQTGWLQGYKHGFIFDSTVNDFISGEIERAILECAEAQDPDIILIEGQSSMRNPSGPCGSEFLLSGDVKSVVLQHVPFRKEFDISDTVHYSMPSVESEIELIRFYGAETLAIALNGEGGNVKELIACQKDLEKRLGIPVIRPLQEGMSGLLPAIQNFVDSAK